MKVLLKLYNVNDKAADSSQIPSGPTKEYLSSDDYKTVIKDKLGIGGYSHKDRKLSAEYRGTIGADDQVIINDNALFYFTRIWMDDASGDVFGEIEFFDPKLFSGKRKDNIINLEGTLKSGVNLPCSIVIHALWNTMEVAEKIIRIKGVDFTQNNSFPNAGVLKVYSDITPQGDTEYEVPMQTEYTKSYSNCKEKIKVFSAEVVTYSFDDTGVSGGFGDRFGESKPEEKSIVKEIKDELKEQVLNDIKNDLKEELKTPNSESKVDDENIPMDPKSEVTKNDIAVDNDDISKSDGISQGNLENKNLGKRFSKLDILEKYGINSPEYHIYRNFSENGYIGEFKLKSELNKLSDEKPIITIKGKNEYKITDADHEELMSILHELIESDDERLIQDIFKSGLPRFTQIIYSVPKDEPNRKEILKIKLNEFFRNDPELRIFSTFNSVRDRMFIAKYPRLTVVARIFKSYKRYWEAEKDSLDEVEKKLFDKLVIQDLNMLIKDTSERVLNNSTIQKIYGLAQFGDQDILTSAQKLSKLYKQVLLSNKIIHFIPEMKYKQWTDALKDFYNACLNYIKGEGSDTKLEVIDTLV